MARIFITGSADGLGRMAARRLVERKHAVVLHARDEARGAEALVGVPGAEGVVTGDLSTLAGMREVADRANAFATFDAVIHNAGVGYQRPSRIETADGLPQEFAVNTLAPYVLTARMARPKRLVYISSGLHKGGDPSLCDLAWKRRPWNGLQAYSDTKLHDILIAFAIARLWPDVLSNAVEPGWVATKMGGAQAPGDLEAGSETQAWLAAGGSVEADVSGLYLFHKQPREPHPACRDTAKQDALLSACRSFSGIDLTLN